MSSMSYKSCSLLLFFLVILLADLGSTLPSASAVKDDPITESREEIDDLNKNLILRDSPALPPSKDAFSHRDEDSPTAKVASMPAMMENYKYDVEILESNEMGKYMSGVELEERYRGPAIAINTDEFINENIELNAADEVKRQHVTEDSLDTSHLILSIVLVALALCSIGLYVAFMVWRNHIEQRYGMRELLVTSDNQDYWPQHMTDPALPQQFQQRAASD